MAGDLTTSPTQPREPSLDLTAGRPEPASPPSCAATSARAPLRLAPQPADWAGHDPRPVPRGQRRCPALRGSRRSWRSPTGTRSPATCGWWPAACQIPLAPPRPDEILRSRSWSPRKRPACSRCGPALSLPSASPCPLPAGHSDPVNLDVTGIVEPTDPGSSFWSADPLLRGPALDYQPDGSAIWDGAVIADPGEFGMIQSVFGYRGPRVQWELPADTAGLHGQAQAAVQPGEPDHEPDSRADRAARADRERADRVRRPGPAAGCLCPGLDRDERPAVDGLCGPGGGEHRDAAPRDPDDRGPPVRGAGHAPGTRSVTGAAVLARVRWRGGGLRASRRRWPGRPPCSWSPDAALAGPAAWWPGIATLAVATAGPGVAAAWQHRLPPPPAGAAAPTLGRPEWSSRSPPAPRPSAAS